ncbi:MAG: heavy metal translocating P-type ATPase [Synergistaceae bacterium]|jgi:Cu2+-exporting ATPase|nr:heavy metal translocating P-type ATPase [Synergistaceae bacterium]
MDFTIVHELPGRLRLRCADGAFTMREAGVIGLLLETQPGVLRVAVSHRTSGLLIHYEGDRESVLTAVRLLDKSFYEDADVEALTPADRQSLTGAAASLLGGALGRRFLLPGVLRYGFTLLRALPLLKRGLCKLLRTGRLNVSVLDASAVGVSLLRRDFRTAAVITTLLALGDLLEDWTRKKSRESLIGSLAVNLDKIWVRRGGEETRIPAADLQIGDLVIVRAGGVIPVDGVVFEGEATVNQAAMTGESEPVRRVPPLSVFAGTIVEEGELILRVTAFDSETRICKIAEMIDASVALKADVQNHAERMADAIVPYNFLLAGGIYLWTRDAVRATSALLVDYSCALRLSTPLAILAAMREGTKRGVLIKGGKFLEALAAADTVVFDKTGTLTVSVPRLAKVVPFEGRARKEVLRTAACLEEHFPHSVARAVVKLAEEENLSHREEHSTVEYMVAHGVVSRLRGERVLIGSAHFVFEDEKIPVTSEQREIIEREAGDYSALYLAEGGRLTGLLCVEDPLRSDAREVINRLRDAGINRMVMLTGDNPRVAEKVARETALDEFRAQLLPEDKTEAIKMMKRSGAKVVMVGDGINDAPALAAADVGVAMRGGADVARETADIVISENRLEGLIDARRLAAGTMRKIYSNFAFIVGANSFLLALGLGGILTPATSALLHNLATIGSSVYSLTPVLTGYPTTTSTGE